MFKVFRISQGKTILLKTILWTSLVVQWLRLRASTAGGTGLIPGRGTKIPHAAQRGKKKKKKKNSLRNGLESKLMHILLCQAQIK